MLIEKSGMLLENLLGGGIIEVFRLRFPICPSHLPPSASQQCLPSTATSLKRFKMTMAWMERFQQSWGN